jgi:hypothetical protein
MKKNHTSVFFVLMIILLLLAACAPAAAPAGQPTPSQGEEVPSTGTDFGNLSPNDILIQMDYEPTFMLPQFAHPFGRVPTFTLFADGRVIYADAYNYPQVLQAQLSPEEAETLVNQIWEMGFGDLESHTDMCIDRGGEQECVADASFTILRVRSEAGELREIRNYANFANNQAAYQGIVDMLTFYGHPQAEAYIPQHATVNIQPEPETYGEAAVAWPLDPSYLTNPPPAPLNYWAVAIEGEEITQYLQAAGSLDRRFFEHEGQYYSANLVPWLPGVDFSQQIEEAFPQP